MPGIIQDYSYDIFISYRQKDNKHDGWVTEFVSDLKGELESTFREEISVYFDVNPHDGLLETHDVDESLKEKLRCLIFIPVISRTYCDPRSFAWEHEFRAFVEMASQDRFGLKVRLPNGNVANRVLPVSIHELEKEDIAQCEALLGGVLRGVEFVYREPGIDKPLSADDDEKKNLNKTKYKLQVIKVAHAVRELIQGIKEAGGKDQTAGGVSSDLTGQGQHSSPGKSALKAGTAKILSISGTALLLITALLLLYPRIIHHDKFSDIRNAHGKISIAVLPFENLTGDSTLAYLGKGLSSLLINGLGNSGELSVCDDPTLAEAMEGLINEATLTPSQARIIAGKVNSDTYITGNFQGVQDKYLVMINLVNAETGKVIWTDKAEGDLRTAEYLDIGYSLCEKAKNYLEIKALEENADLEFREAFPKSAEAYRYFIEGMTGVLNKDIDNGIKNLKKSLDIDSAAMTGFYLMYAYCYNDQTDSSAAVLAKIYPQRDRIPPKYRLWMEMWNACYFGSRLQDITKYCDQLAESGINTRLFWFDLGVTYHDYTMDYLKSAHAFEKVLKICNERGDEWKFPKFYTFYGEDLHKIGRHEEEQEIYELGLKVFPENWSLLTYKSICYVSRGDTIKAKLCIDQLKACIKKDKLPENVTEFNLGYIYSVAGLSKEAEIHIRRALKIKPDHMYYNYALIYLLIDRELNIGEGMELVTSVLDTLPPENGLYGGLKILKGIGKLKQGKVEEAVEIMEKEWSKGFMTDMSLYHYLPEARQALAERKGMR